MLTVEDDGRGFVVEEAMRAERHFGLNGLKERASLVGGALEVASRPGEGTRVRLSTKIESEKSRT